MTRREVIFDLLDRVADDPSAWLKLQGVLADVRAYEMTNDVAGQLVRGCLADLEEGFAEEDRRNPECMDRARESRERDLS